jgi:hypothetical protein
VYKRRSSPGVLIFSSPVIREPSWVFRFSTLCYFLGYLDIYRSTLPHITRRALQRGVAPSADVVRYFSFLLNIYMYNFFHFRPINQLHHLYGWFSNAPQPLEFITVMMMMTLSRTK